MLSRLAVLFPIVVTVAITANPPRASAGEIPGVYHPWNDVDLGGVATLNGNVTVTLPSNEVTGLVGQNGNFKGLSGSIELRGAITADVVASATGSFTVPVPLAAIPLPVIPVTGVVSIAPMIGLFGIVTGNVEAGARFGLMEQFESTFSITLDNQGMNAALLGTPTTFHRFAPPEVAGGSQVGLGVAILAGVTFQIVVNGIPIGGPTIVSQFGLGAVVNPLANPWWEIDAAVTNSILWLGPGFTLGATQIGTPVIVHVADAGGPFSLMPPASRWSRTYDLGGDEDVTGVKALADGFLVTGNGMGVNNRPYLAKIGLDGVPVWEKRGQAIPFGTLRPNSVATATNGDIMLAGYTLTSGGGRVDRFDAAGTPLWSKILNGPSPSLLQVHSMIAGANDSVIVAGEVTHIGPNQPRPFVAELDSTGAIQWSQEFDPGAASPDGRFRQVIATQDGGLMLVGAMTYTDQPAPNSTISQPNILAVKLDSNHSVQFAKVIGTTLWDEAFCVCEGEDGSFVIGGQTPSWAAPNVHAALIVALDQNGELKWSKVYAGEEIGGSSGDTPYDAINGIVAIDGGYAVTGYTGLPSAVRDTWLIHLDDVGIATSFKSFRTAQRDEFRGLVPVDGGAGGFLAYGFSAQVGPQNDLWLARTQVDGYLDFAPQYGFDCWNDDMDWGPANDIVAMTMPGSLIALTITTSNGAQGFDVVGSSSTEITP
jgi:hypothetical protein